MRDPHNSGDSGMALAIIGFFGAGLAMIGHVLGVVLGLWPHSYPTVYVPLVCFSLMYLGLAIDTRRSQV